QLLRRVLIHAGVLAGLFVVAAAPLRAQRATTDARWQPWIGCWQLTGTPRTAPVLCIVPAGAASSVEVLTIADAKVAARERIDATGTDRPVSKEGCSGSEHAQWSADNRRVFLRS